MASRSKIKRLEQELDTYLKNENDYWEINIFMLEDNGVLVNRETGEHIEEDELKEGDRIKNIIIKVADAPDSDALDR